MHHRCDLLGRAPALPRAHRHVRGVHLERRLRSCPSGLRPHHLHVPPRLHGRRAVSREAVRRRDREMRGSPGRRRHLRRRVRRVGTMLAFARAVSAPPPPWLWPSARRGGGEAARAEDPARGGGEESARQGQQVARCALRGGRADRSRAGAAPAPRGGALRDRAARDLRGAPRARAPLAIDVAAPKRSDFLRLEELPPVALRAAGGQSGRAGRAGRAGGRWRSRRRASTGWASARW